MQPLATHLYVCITETLSLAKRAARPATFSNLGPVPDNVDSLLDSLDNSEWLQVEAVLREQTQSAASALPAGGINPGDQRAVFTLVRRIKPKRVLEIGTHLGYSTCAIALALQLNHEEGHLDSNLVSVDLRDVNDDPCAPWRRALTPRAPKDAVAAIARDIDVRFVQATSLDYLSTTADQFDLVFLDGDHAAPTVFEELHLLNGRLVPDGTVLLHDYFPDGRALWQGSLPCTGPWRAIRRLQRDGSPLRVHPMGALPWPTKLGSHRSSLAILGREKI